MPYCIAQFLSKLRPEIMPPFRDRVRLVENDGSYRNRRIRADSQRVALKASAAKALGGDIDEADLASPNLFNVRLIIIRTLRLIELRNTDAPALELRDLIQA